MLETLLGRRLHPGKSGRPKKVLKDPTEEEGQGALFDERQIHTLS